MTKLKCKPCGLFYKDDGSVSKCEKCGEDLKRITVHTLKIKPITIVSKRTKIKGNR